MEKYARVSSRIMGLLFEFTDLLEQLSIDEAFLDVTGSEKLFGSGVEIGRKIKERIVRELQLTASVGVAANKFVAKVASDLRKPDGLVVVEAGREEEFLAPLPIRRLWGVGPKTETHLREIGIESIGQVAAMQQSDLVARLGRSGAHLWQLSHGIDDRPVSPEEGFKSIGHENTFEQDTGDPELIHKTVLHLTQKVSQRLREKCARARTISVKYREADFSTYTRRITLSEPVDTAEKIFPVAVKLLKTLLREKVLVRLVGVYASNLEITSSGKQMALFGESQKDRKLAAAIDDIAQRFGDNAITRAALVKKG
jgi:nucleotidyltransferase/DNA polymerase involved in DNA repair